MKIEPSARLLTTQQVAEILSLTPNAVRILVYRKRLDRLKLGRLNRYRLEDVMKLMGIENEEQFQQIL